MQIQKRNSRVSKEGCFYTGLRVGGLLLKVFGGLTLVAGTVGFIITFFRSASDLISVIQGLENQMAQFVFTLIMVWLGTFAAIGCIGLVMIGVGFGLNFASTEMIPSTKEQPIDKPLPSA